MPKGTLLARKIGTKYEIECYGLYESSKIVIKPIKHDYTFVRIYYGNILIGDFDCHPKDVFESGYLPCFHTTKITLEFFDARRKPITDFIVVRYKEEYLGIPERIVFTANTLTGPKKFINKSLTMEPYKDCSSSN